MSMCLSDDPNYLIIPCYLTIFVHVNTLSGTNMCGWFIGTQLNYDQLICISLTSSPTLS